MRAGGFATRRMGSDAAGFRSSRPGQPTQIPPSLSSRNRPASRTPHPGAHIRTRGTLNPRPLSARASALPLRVAIRALPPHRGPAAYGCLASASTTAPRMFACQSQKGPCRSPLQLPPRHGWVCAEPLTSRVDGESPCAFYRRIVSRTESSKHLLLSPTDRAMATSDDRPPRPLPPRRVPPSSDGRAPRPGAVSSSVPEVAARRATECAPARAIRHPRRLRIRKSPTCPRATPRLDRDDPGPPPRTHACSSFGAADRAATRPARCGASAGRDPPP